MSCNKPYRSIKGGLKRYRNEVDDAEITIGTRQSGFYSHDSIMRIVKNIKNRMRIPSRADAYCVHRVGPCEREPD